MEKNFTIHSEKDIDRVAKEIIPLLQEYKVVAFYGNMGVGKTTFIKGVCKVLGVEDAVTSPSFAIVNEYQGYDNQQIFHFDFYRLKDVSEVFDMGYEDYFFSDHLCLIEWPGKIDSVLPDGRLDAYLSENEDGSRQLKLKTPD